MTADKEKFSEVFENYKKIRKNNYKFDSDYFIFAFHQVEK